MNVKIEDAGPCKKILRFEIPKETVEAELEKKLDEVCSSVIITGFRKGRAPRKLVEKRYGAQIKDEVRQSIVNDCYQKALEEYKLNPAGTPSFSEANLEIGQSFNFDITLEVWPTFEVNNYKGIKLHKKPVEVTDEDVEGVLRNLSLKKAQVTVVNDGKVEKGDQIICDCKIEVGGSTVFEDEDVEIFARDNCIIAGINVPDIATKLEGAESGKECILNVNTGKDFVKKEYRDQDATVRVMIKEIKRLTLPEVNEEFAKTLGYESLDDLKTNIRKQVEEGKKRQAEDDLRNQLLDILLDQTQFELPKEFVEHHTERRVYKHQMDLLRRGYPIEEIQKKTKAIKSASADSVMRELKASLILDYIAEKEKIFVTETEVEKRIADIARIYNTDIGRVRNLLERRGSLSYLRNDMRENKVLDFLLKEAKIE